MILKWFKDAHFFLKKHQTIFLALSINLEIVAPTPLSASLPYP